MTYSHFSNAVVSSVYSVKQRPPNSAFDKPKGFWISVDGDCDWASWCKSESFGLGNNRHKVSLSKDANILKLCNAIDLLDFTELYKSIYKIYRWDRIAIDWTRVAEKYQGIVIAPYVWDCRMTLDWYYPWDCASGCIWDSQAISSVELQR